MTDAQVEANRANAQKSTGPVTPEGKAVSRYNALKFGLLSKEVLLEGEDEDNLVELERRLRSELAPMTEIEALLVDRIIAQSWRLRRVLEVERAIMERRKFLTSLDFALGSQFEDEDQKAKQQRRERIEDMVDNEAMDRLQRYEVAIERSLYRAMHELQRIQSARAGERPPAPMALDIDVVTHE